MTGSELSDRMPDNNEGYPHGSAPATVIFDEIGGHATSPVRVRESRGRGLPPLDVAAIEAEAARCSDAGTRSAITTGFSGAARRLTDARWRCCAANADGYGMWQRRGRYQLRLIHSIARELDGHIWAHLSLSRADGHMPDWEQLRDAWRLVHPDVYGVVVIAPEDRHVNLSEVAHVWGNLDAPAVPDFTHGMGTI